MSAGKFDPLKVAAGERIGPYEVVGLEAEGGYGFLYRVRRGEKVYALKIGRYDFGSQYPDDRARDEERLDREIAAMKTLRHPNIVRVLAFDRWPDLEDGYPYIVMEYIEGQRLDEWQAESAPALDRVVAIYEKIAVAVEHMHAHGIFHRDLKAQNVVVRPDGEPVVLDFSLARPRHAHEVTRAGTIGTMSHFAPEYVRWCDSAASLTEPFVWRPSTDLHAFGHMLYMALTGRSPYADDAGRRPASDTELLLAIKKIVPRPASSWNQRIPAALDELTARLLAKDPDQRPGSAAEVAATLRQAREAAVAAGDTAWTEPFDLAGADAGAPPGSRGSAASPPPEEGAAPSAEAPGPSGEVQIIPGGDPRGGRRVDLPPAPENASYQDENAEAAAPDGKGARDPLDDDLKALKAQVAASAPRRRRSPLLAGGIALGATLLLVVVAARLQPAPRDGPKTLLSMSDSSGLEPGPGGSSLRPAPAGGPGDAPLDTVHPEKTGSADGPEVRSEPSVARPKPSPRAPSGQVDLPAERIEPAFAPVPAPTAASPDQSPIVRSRPLDQVAVLQRSVRTDPPPASPSGPPKPRGVPYGAHVRARLLSNLDTRTIGSGPVEAVLPVPHLVRGEIVLPARTMVYGTATETNGRFTVRFFRLRLPDDTEIAIEALALARDDGKPGLAASRRIDRPPEQREGVASQIAKGTGNTLLDTISGGVPIALARDAGRTALNDQQVKEAPAGVAGALLLDAGVVFDLWVERAF